MAINIAYNAAGQFLSNVAPTTSPMITVHGTGGETGVNRIIPLTTVLTMASTTPTDTTTNNYIIRSGRTLRFNRIMIRVTGNAVVDLSGFDLDFINLVGQGGVWCAGFNQTAPTTTNGDFNGQAGIISNQCNINYYLQDTSAAGRGFTGPWYAHSTWDATDCTINMNADATTTPSNWDSPGRSVTMDNATGNPTGGSNNRATSTDQPLFNLNNVRLTDGTGFAWGPVAFSGMPWVLNPSSVLNNVTINTGQSLQLTVGEFEGFQSASYISGFNPQGSTIYGGLNFVNSRNTSDLSLALAAESTAGAWKSQSRATPMEFRNYDFGASWNDTANDRIRIQASNPQSTVWYRWLYDWNITFQEGNGRGDRLNGADFDVFIRTGDLTTNAGTTDTLTDRITDGQLWASTSLANGRNTTHADGAFAAQPTWTPARNLANPSDTEEQEMFIAGQAQTNIPILKYWTNGNTRTPNPVFQTTGFDAIFARYPFQFIDFNNEQIEPRNTMDRTTAGINFNNPIPTLVQTVIAQSGITEESRANVAAYGALNSTAAVFDRAYYDKEVLVNAATTAATKRTANTANPILVLNNDGELVPGNSSDTNIVFSTASTTPAITRSSGTITINTGGSLTLNHTVRVTGTITRTGVTVDLNGFSLIDGNAPNIAVTGIPTGVQVQFYNYTGDTLVSNTPFHTLTADGSFNRTQSGFTAAISAIRVVAFGTGFSPRITDITLGTSDVNLDYSTLIPISYPDTALSAASILTTAGTTGTRVYVSADSLDTTNNRLTLSIDGTQLQLTDSQTNDWIQRVVASRTNYGRLIAITGETNILQSSGGLGFASSFSTRILFQSGTVNNNGFTMGHLGNLTQGQGSSAFSVARQLTLQGGGTTSVTVSFAGSPSNFDAGSLDVSIANAGLVTTTDLTNAQNNINTNTDNARDVVIGNL